MHIPAWWNTCFSSYNYHSCFSQGMAFFNAIGILLLQYGRPCGFGSDMFIANIFELCFNWENKKNKRHEIFTRDLRMLHKFYSDAHLTKTFVETTGYDQVNVRTFGYFCNTVSSRFWSGDFRLIFRGYISSDSTAHSIKPICQTWFSLMWARTTSELLINWCRVPHFAEAFCCHIV